jgi:hypothetical protein
MAQARPISMVVWAMLMFLLGGLSIFASLGGFITAHQAMSTPLASLQGGSSAIAMLILLAALLNLGGGVLGIMAGIRLLKVARWGWGVTLAYAIVLLGYEGLMLHLIFDAFGWLYPLILIIFLHTPQWKNAFAARQLQGLHG